MQLNAQSDAPESPVSGRGLRVLVLDEWIPYPPDSGKRARTWNILRRLARRHECRRAGGWLGPPERMASPRSWDRRAQSRSPRASAADECA